MSTTPPKFLPNPEYVRTLPDLTLVGVVHDHPASVARVEAVVRDSSHETLALELPPLAIPLYRSYATDDGFSPNAGGEMSAAIRASDASTVGIDGPSRAFSRAFYRYIGRESLDSGTVERLYGSVRTASKRAFLCRLAATATGRRSGIEGERPFVYDCDPDDDLVDLAADERSHVSMARSATAFSPPHVAHRDAIREECMAEALGERYRTGLEERFAEHGIEGRVAGYGSVFAPQFGVCGEPRNYEDVLGLDESMFAEFARGMRERGHFFTPNPYKRQHLSWAHGERELEAYLADADAVLGSLASG